MTKHHTPADLAASLRKSGLPVDFKYRANPKRSSGPSESDEQQEVVLWWESFRLGYGVPERLLFAVPLQAARTPRNGARMKREGARSGTPDLFLMLMRGGFGALAIEMKSATGVMSDDQKDFRRDLTQAGYCHSVCRSAKEAKEQIMRYCELPISS